uniref:Uncharacterized protein n=1 Tax=Candidatus Kentrum sp. DK TaxID=2126562 RepID=A0A450SFN9_9GAMM|nr:MAG: hypothetical protein BECKDK2373B_GA0170837_103412 [Candidatus Kentron sp. DK]
MALVDGERFASSRLVVPYRHLAPEGFLLSGKKVDAFHLSTLRPSSFLMRFAPLTGILPLPVFIGRFR